MICGSIKYDAASVGAVLKYYKDAGFNEQKKQASLPAGIDQSADQLVVTHKQDDGKKKYTVSVDLDDLPAWEAKMSSGGDDEQAGDDDEQHAQGGA